MTVSALKAKVVRRTAYLTSRVTVSAAGRITQKATSGSGRKARTRCRTSKAVAAAGTYTLKCSMGRKGRAYLRRRALRLDVATTLVPASGAAVSKAARLKVKRKR